ncbi:MAG: nucleotide exchange factor GrpE [candidate division Zixibacteria bacterium]|nr:nucleotide exchange factor GrpE [candidate division Zixibacteria bacterium]
MMEETTGNKDISGGQTPEEPTAPSAEFGVEESSAKEEAPAAAAEETKAVETESERYLRLAADFDNFRKRTAREFDELTRAANARLLQSLVAVVDDFERALEDEAARGEAEAYRRGVELIYGKLQDLLQRERVTVMEVIGRPFDPAWHEALMQQPSDEYPEGTVSGVVQKGYLLGDKVLRHARVVVSSGPNMNHTEKNVRE